MNLFMMWMMGNSLHIFTIMMLVGVMFSPLKAIMSVNETFRPFRVKGESQLNRKMVFIGINLFILSMGAYKLYNIGLLPLSPADHVDWIPIRHPNQITIDLTN